MKDHISCGQATETFYQKVLEPCFQQADQKTLMGLKKAMEAINVESFVNYYVPSPDVETFCAACALVGTAWLTDDVLDEHSPNSDAVEILATAWSTIPRCIDEIFCTEQNIQEVDVDLLTDMAVTKLRSKPGIPKIDGLVRLYAYACAFAKVQSVKNHNDPAYRWFDQTSRDWIQHNVENIGGNRDSDDWDTSLTLQDALASRSMNGGYRFFMAWILASVNLGGLDPNIYSGTTLDEVCEYAGLHTCLLNDILSYDRELSEKGAASESIVQFFRQRQACRKNPDDDHRIQAALDATVAESNRLMDKLAVLVSRVQSNESDKQIMLDSYNKVFQLAIQGVAGNIQWCLGADRYARRDYVRDLAKL